MVSALDSGSSGPGSSPAWPGSLCCVLYSHSASLHPGVQIVPATKWLAITEGKRNKDYTSLTWNLSEEKVITL